MKAMKILFLISFLGMNFAFAGEKGNGCEEVLIGPACMSLTTL